jgi:hypothetical protein
MAFKYLGEKTQTYGGRADYCGKLVMEILSDYKTYLNSDRVV